MDVQKILFYNDFFSELRLVSPKSFSINQFMTSMIMPIFLEIGALEILKNQLKGGIETFCIHDWSQYVKVD